MQIKTFALGPLETNCYLLMKGKEAALVDVGGDVRELLDYLEKTRIKLTDILVTHMHFDHVLGVAELALTTGARVWSNERDEYLLEPHNNVGFPMPERFEYQRLDEGPTNFLGESCQVFATPGHTPGSLSYYFSDSKALFCGDVIFYRSVGRTDFLGGDTDTLMNSIRNKIYTLPDDTVIYPGHMLQSNVGDEKRLNPFVQA